MTQTLRDKSRLSQELFRYSIEHMAAVPAAADAMAKYTGEYFNFLLFDFHTDLNLPEAKSS